MQEETKHGDIHEIVMDVHRNVWNLLGLIFLINGPIAFQLSEWESSATAS